MSIVCRHPHDDGFKLCPDCRRLNRERLAAYRDIDHIDGGGNTHRREVCPSGAGITRWLITQGFPTGFQILCHNCNLAMGFYGYCPHERELRLVANEE